MSSWNRYPFTGEPNKSPFTGWGWAEHYGGYGEERFFLDYTRRSEGVFRLAHDTPRLSGICGRAVMERFYGDGSPAPSTGPVDTLKALAKVERQIRLERAEVLSLNQRLKALERRVSNIEQWKGEQK